jgi:hypothetical protein
MKRQSTAKAREARVWRKLVVDLIAEVRCCELCYYPWLLTGHHIIKRSQGGTHTRDNCIILCQSMEWHVDGCHDHSRFGSGMKCTLEQAQEIVRRRECR